MMHVAVVWDNVIMFCMFLTILDQNISKSYFAMSSKNLNKMTEIYLNRNDQEFLILKWKIQYNKMLNIELK